MIKNAAIRSLLSSFGGLPKSKSQCGGPDKKAGVRLDSGRGSIFLSLIFFGPFFDQAKKGHSSNPLYDEVQGFRGGTTAPCSKENDSISGLVNFSPDNNNLTLRILMTSYHYLNEKFRILTGTGEIATVHIAWQSNQAEGMIKLVASTFIGNGSLWLYLDNKLIMQNSDSATVELEENKEYIVHWFVMGSPGASYSITISSPRMAECQWTRVINSSTKDHGAIRFSS